MRQKNNNLIALGIGFLLIMLIALATFWRSRPSSQDQSGYDQLAKEQQAVSNNLNKATKLSPDDLMAKTRSRADIIMIDIRDSASFSQEHILNSKNIPLPKLKDGLAALDKSKTYVIIDSGQALESTALAAGIMSDGGFKNIYYLDGGFSAWKNSYGPTISAGDPNSFTDQSKVNYVNSDQIKNMLASAGTDLAVIDVRNSKDYAAGHIPSAINIFLDDLEKRRGDIPLGKKIIVYDNDGLGAFKAAVRLFDMGYYNTFAMSDGFNSWKQKNYQIAR